MIGKEKILWQSIRYNFKMWPQILLCLDKFDNLYTEKLLFSFSLIYWDFSIKNKSHVYSQGIKIPSLGSASNWFGGYSYIYQQHTCIMQDGKIDKIYEISFSTCLYSNPFRHVPFFLLEDELAQLQVPQNDPMGVAMCHGLHHLVKEGSSLPLP